MFVFNFQKPILTPIKRKLVPKPIIAAKMQATAAAKNQCVETVEPIMLNVDSSEPAPKRPMLTTRPIQRAPIANTPVAQKSVPQKSLLKQSPPEPAAGKPRILNQASKVLNTSVQFKSIKSPDLKTNENGSIELVLESRDEPLNVAELERLGAESDVFPCPHCDRTYVLKQLLDMHILTHNRERCSQCDYCGKKYLSKYDLAKHVLTHSEVKPFLCSVCNKGFTRSSLLSRHEKVHTDQVQHECSFCEKTFLTIADLEKHESNHRKRRPFGCKVCEKSFAFKQGLERHEITHQADQPYKCEYCDEGFSTPTKLARHLTAHAGRRPYPCRLCPNSYLLSHHLARHLRSHQNVESTFVCNNCPECFTSLNDLILHSEIHAMDQYVCSLCKVELSGAVEMSEHIQLHATEQFSCEFCDLIFVTEDQKNQHCEEDHVDEQAEYARDTKTRKIKKEVDGSNQDEEEADEADEADEAEAEEGDEVNAEFEIEVMDEETVLAIKQQQPRRGRPPKVKDTAQPTILNYIKNTKPQATPTNVRYQQIEIDNRPNLDENDIVSMEFDIVDDIKVEHYVKDAPVLKASPQIKKSSPTVATKKPSPRDVAPAEPSPKMRKISVSPPKKTSPAKYVPIAQQKLEQQLQNAMKTTTSTPSKPAIQIKTEPTTSTPKPVLTKVNFKQLPGGVTLKKLVPAKRPESFASAISPKPSTSAAATPDKPTQQKRTTQYGGPSKAPAGVKPPMQRVKMTQAQVDAMAKEGKIQMKNGQVFLRSTKST